MNSTSLLFVHVLDKIWTVQKLHYFSSLKGDPYKWVQEAPFDITVFIAFIQVPDESRVALIEKVANKKGIGTKYEPVTPGVQLFRTCK